MCLGLPAGTVSLQLDVGPVAKMIYYSDSSIAKIVHKLPSLVTEGLTKHVY